MRIPKHAYGLAFLLVLGAAGSSVPALAQSSSSAYPQCPAGKVITAEESDAAHTKYKSGRVDYDEGKYASAITNFKEAYAKDCTKHEVLIIISRAYELNGDKRAALEALETFLARVPATYPERSTLEAKRDTLRQQVASMPSATATPAATATPSTTTTSQPPPPSAGESRGHTPYPWIVVGVGAALVIAGSLVVATAPKLPDNCNAGSEKCSVPQGAVPCAGANTPPGCYDLTSDQNKAGTAKNQPPIGYGIIAGGALAVVGGLVWFFLEPTGSSSKESAKTKVAPELGKGFGGLSLSTSF